MFSMLTRMRIEFLKSRITRRLNRYGNYKRFEVGAFRAFHGSSWHESCYVCVGPDAHIVADDPKLLKQLLDLDQKVKRHVRDVSVRRYGVLRVPAF